LWLSWFKVRIFYALAPRILRTGRMAHWAATSVTVTVVAFD
jgi:hypothetical protein